MWRGIILGGLCHRYANQSKILKFIIFHNYWKSHLHKLQMTATNNDNQEQGYCFNINAKLQEILALAKEIEHLTKAKDN